MHDYTMYRLCTNAQGLPLHEPSPALMSAAVAFVEEVGFLAANHDGVAGALPFGFQTGGLEYIQYLADGP